MGCPAIDWLNKTTDHDLGWPLSAAEGRKFSAPLAQKKKAREHSGDRKLFDYIFGRCNYCKSSETATADVPSVEEQERYRVPVFLPTKIQNFINTHAGTHWSR